jgi:starch synthase
MSMTPLSNTKDSAITRPYDVTTLEYKVQNKTALQEELGWAAEPKRAVVCIPMGVSDQLGGKLLEEVLPGLLELPVEILILGKGSASYGQMLTKLAKDHSHRIAIIPNDQKMVAKMLAAADMALFLCQSSGTEELTSALRYGTVPVTPAGLNLHDYNPNQESGNAFTYQKENVWHCYGALVRALETFKFPYDWKTIQKECMGKN